MKTLECRNRMGQKFVLMEHNILKTRVLHKEDEIIVNASILQMEYSWIDWTVRNRNIQDAFTFLNPDEREFLMSGMTKEKWAECFTEVDH